MPFIDIILIITAFIIKVSLLLIASSVSGALITIIFLSQNFIRTQIADLIKLKIIITEIVLVYIIAIF